MLPPSMLLRLPLTRYDRPFTNATNANTTDMDDKAAKDKTRAPRERRERGPPADGIPSKTKVMVANLPYDLTEEKASILCDTTTFVAHY
jgi:hypothetical protein